MKKYISKFLLLPMMAAIPFFASSCLNDDEQSKSPLTEATTSNLLTPLS